MMINFESFNYTFARKKILNTFLSPFKNMSVGLVSALLLAICALPTYAVTFQAEDYSAFNDTTAGNQGGAYRSDNVDIEATSDTGGGFNVGWIETGEWLA